MSPTSFAPSPAPPPGLCGAGSCDTRTKPVAFAVLTTVAVAAGAFLTGWVLSRWYVTRTVVRAAQPPLPTPLPPEAYAKRRVELVDMYKYGQQQYDRLIPWGSGGALLISITLLEKSIRAPVPGTMPILAMGWGLLFAALAAAIVGHYTSARSYEAGWDALDIAQLTPEDRVGHARQEKRAWRMNGATKLLNFIAGLGLLAGVALVIWFAYLNLSRRVTLI